MNHPKREEWVPFLFGEANPDARRALNAHLRACADCRAELNRWRQTVGRLDAWKLPRLQPSGEWFAPFWKWVAAGAAVLLVGFAAGRFSDPSVDAAQIRATIEPQIRQQLQQELTKLVHEEANQVAVATLAAAGRQSEAMLAAYAKAVEASQTEESQGIYAALGKLATQRVRDYVSLRQDLETVAVNTDAGLRQTEQQLVQLAGYSPSASFPKTSEK